MRNYFLSTVCVALSSVVISPTAIAASLASMDVSIPELTFQANKGSGVIQTVSVEFDGEEPTSGVPDATSMFTVVPNISEPAKIELLRSEKTFKISTGPFNFSIKNSPDMLQKLNTLKVSKFITKLGLTNKSEIKISDLFMNHDSFGDVDMSGAVMTCINQGSVIQDFAQILNQCLVKMSLNIDRFDVPDMNAFFTEAFFGLPQTVDPSANLTLKDMDLNIVNGDFDLNLKIKYMPLTKVKGYGHIDLDMAQNQATIRVDKVKFGLLNVTDTVMKQLKKRLPPEKFRVENPYIYITL